MGVGLGGRVIGLFSAHGPALSEGQPPSFPEPVSSRTSGLGLRGEAWGTDVGLGGTGACGCGVTAQKGWGGLHLPGAALEMGIWEVTEQHREGVGEMRWGRGKSRGCIKVGHRGSVPQGPLRA